MGARHTGAPEDPAQGGAMNVTVYGLAGHAGRVEVPLETLEVDELEAGREFEYNGRVYEIRSVTESEQGFRINVVMAVAMGRM
jgi:hypothetical protein